MDDENKETQSAVSKSSKEDYAEAAFSKMSQEELRRECLSLKKENGLLNCRLLGVEELARLLQEKTEAVENVKDKNKRLELAVVRLENRCSNMEKKAKTQQQNTSSNSMPSSTNSTANKGQQQQGSQQQQQNPFIPGPSKQILETLMRENTDLKKTLDNMTKKGPTGYREAVKMNQLEEVIDQKNEKIEMLNGQLQSLTAAAQKDGDNGGTDIGTLQRQLLKMEHSMKVKDRFCTLLSERVNQLQREITDTKNEPDIGPDSGIGQNEEYAVKERNMRRMIDELQHQVEKERGDKMDALTQADDNRQKLIDKHNELETLQGKYNDSILYTETLLNDKMSLLKQLEIKDPSSSRADFQREIENKNMQIDQLKRLLEEAQYKYALAESKQGNYGRIEELEEKIKDLEEERSGLENEIFDNKRKIQDLMHHNTRLRFGNLGTHYALKTGGAPSLDLRSSHQGDDVIADSSKSLHDTIKDTMRQEVPPLNSRDVGTDGSTDATSSASPPTPTYTTPDTACNRPLHSSSINPIPSSMSSSTRGNYRTNVPTSTPIMTSHVYPGNSQIMGTNMGPSTSGQVMGPSNSGQLMGNSGNQLMGTSGMSNSGILYSQDMTPRHLYQQQPSDASLYQTHSGTPMSGYAPQFSTGSGGMHFGTGVGPTNRGISGIPIQRSMSSSPSPYMSSSGGYGVHSSSVPTTNATLLFGQQPSYNSGAIFGPGYTTTPTAYVSQYPPTHQPGQRYDISQHYGGYPYNMTSSSQGNVSNPTSSGGYSSPQPPQGGGLPLPPSSSGLPPQKRHSPPDPR